MHYFVTGATGFIGKRLVKKLLERKGAVVHFLIRQESEGKVAALREYWGLKGSAGAARAVPVFGDLTEKKLGVSAEATKALKGQVDHFYHLAAVYDLEADADSQIAVNIDGTRNTVEFAKAIGAGHFHHVSSIAAAGLYEGVFREDMFDEAEGLDHPYFSTKHESEKIVRTECKLPWTVYRPAVVVGDSRTGEMDKIDGIYYFFKLIQRLRQILPPWMPSVGLEGGRINIVPVDYVVNTLDYLSHHHRSQRQVLPPGGPGGLPRWRRAGHPQQGRSCAQDEPVRQRRAAGLHSEKRQEGPDGAGAGAPRLPCRHAGPGSARGHADLRQLPDALRLPRDRRPRSRAAASNVPTFTITPGACGTTGSGISTPTCTSTAACAALWPARWCW
jgi:nucleoside-diphosphate-sugar epimerase